MSLTHVVTRQYRDISNTPIASVETITGTADRDYDGSVPGTTTDQEIDWTVTRSTLQALCIFSDQTVSIAVNDIHSGSPQEVITITGGFNKIWTLGKDLLATCPFSGDVTKLYVTNSGSAAAKLQIRALVNL